MGRRLPDDLERTPRQRDLDAVASLRAAASKLHDLAREARHVRDSLARHDGAHSDIVGLRADIDGDAIDLRASAEMALDIAEQLRRAPGARR